MEIQRRICTLCTGKCEAFKCIERDTKNILDLFLPEMDFSIIQEPVMCGKCAEVLAKCFEFKTTCLQSYDYLVSLANDKDDVELDLKDLFQSRSTTDTGVPEYQDVCGFCMGLVKNCSAIPLYINDEGYKLDKMVQQCLPELDLRVIKKPVICADCHSSLESCFRFVTDCLTAEERIRLYREKCSSKGQIEISDLLHPAIKTENTNNIYSDLFDIVKIEKQICEDGENFEQNEMVSGVNINKLEETSCFNENSDSNNENVNKSLMVSCNPKVSDEQQLSPKNVLIWEEKSNELGAIKIEETLCVENASKCKDDIFVEIEDKKCLINAEIEIKTDGHDFNSLEDGIHMTPPNARLNGKQECSVPQIFMDNSLKPHIEHACKNKNATKTKSRFTVKRHVLNYKHPSEVAMHKCDSCAYQTILKGNFKTHLLKHKDISEVAGYKCDLCLYQTKYKSKLKMHFLKHKHPSEVTMHKCDSCAYQTILKGYLKQHLLKHKDISEVTMYKCASCAFQAKRKGDLKSHLLTHKKISEVTVYKCDVCLYQTKNNTLLKKHYLKHKHPSEVTMHKCDSCAYQAKHKSNLKTHLLKHQDISEVIVYKCDLCLYQTKNKALLKKHSLKHKHPSEVTMHKCDSCAYQAKLKSNLKKHLLKHQDISEVTVYKCDLCLYQTNNTSVLKKHYHKHKHLQK